MSPAVERFERDRKLATERLKAAEAQSADIKTHMQRWQAIGKSAESALGERERTQDGARSKWLNDSEEDLFAWASESAKLPSIKDLDRIEHEKKTIHIVRSGAIRKMLELTAAMHLSKAVELENKGYLRHIDALQLDLDARETVESIVERLGANARVRVERGDAELAQIDSDELLRASNRELETGNQMIADLLQTERGQNGR